MELFRPRLIVSSKVFQVVFVHLVNFGKRYEELWLENGSVKIGGVGRVGEGPEIWHWVKF